MRRCLLFAQYAKKLKTQVLTTSNSYFICMIFYYIGVICLVFPRIIGIWLLGGIGYYVRKAYSFLAKQLGAKTKNKVSKSDFYNVTDMDKYQNRTTGFVFILYNNFFIKILQA